VDGILYGALSRRQIHRAEFLSPASGAAQFVVGRQLQNRTLRLGCAGERGRKGTWTEALLFEVTPIPQMPARKRKRGKKRISRLPDNLGDREISRPEDIPKVPEARKWIRDNHRREETCRKNMYFIPDVQAIVLGYLDQTFVLKKLIDLQPNLTLPKPFVIAYSQWYQWRTKREKLSLSAFLQILELQFPPGLKSAFCHSDEVECRVYFKNSFRLFKDIFMFKTTDYGWQQIDLDKDGGLTIARRKNPFSGFGDLCAFVDTLD
jgi:hypothetical protein